MDACKTRHSLSPIQRLGDASAPSYTRQLPCEYATVPVSIGPHLGGLSGHAQNRLPRGRPHQLCATSDQAGLNSSAGGFLPCGVSCLRRSGGFLKDGNPYAPGNKLGIPGSRGRTLIRYSRSASQSPPRDTSASPFVSIASNAGRLPRTFQWSIGFQREIHA